MDYEKKYKEAQKWIESIYSELSHEQQMEAEAFFPELKESEDEKIRGAIIHFISHTPTVPKGIIGKETMLAWLEKQGENVSLPKFTFDDVLALQCCMETTKKIQEDKELYEQLQSLHDRIHDAYWLEKQGEQKPIDYNEELKKCRENPLYFFDKYVKIEERKPALSKEDEKIRKTLIDYFKTYKKQEECGIKTFFGIPTDNILAWLEKQGCQKSVDKWYTFKSIPRLLDMIEPTDRAKSYCKKLIDSLQTEGYPVDAKIVGECLKQMNGEKVAMAVMDIEKQDEKKSQRMISAEAKEALYDKPAWSEEDENKIDTIISVYHPSPNIVDWLKSIKQRIVWKPSEEQIKAFEHFVRSIGESGYASPYENNTKLLLSLLNDLKKLTE